MSDLFLLGDSTTGRPARMSHQETCETTLGDFALWLEKGAGWCNPRLPKIAGNALRNALECTDASLTQPASVTLRKSRRGVYYVYTWHVIANCGAISSWALTPCDRVLGEPSPVSLADNKDGFELVIIQ